MKITRFDSTGDLIIVTARVWGPLDDRQILLALDTAASQTHILPDVIDEIGYSPRQGDKVTKVTSASAKSQATC